MRLEKNVYFRFYAELNDFLPQQKKFTTFSYPFFGNPSVKDAIEALGVPHTEVDLILVNQKSVDFSYHLQASEIISVYPVFEMLDITEVTHLRPVPLRQTKFILDVNLGKLTRKLRLLGFDSLYSNSFRDKEIIETALSEKRIILTRHAELLKNRRVTHGYWIRSADPKVQSIEVVKKFDLYSSIRPFRICLNCNGKIKSISKEEVINKLQPNARKAFNDFYICRQCGNIYWKGSHYKRMQEQIERIMYSRSKQIFP